MELNFPDAGLVGCKAVITCGKVPDSAAGIQTGYRLRSEGICGDPDQDLNSPNPDFAVSRTVEAEAFDGATP
ncbi:hypothetical protein D3C85_1680650 [compost metagenome]